MGKLSDKILPIDFQSNPVHTIDFTPNIDDITIQGRLGPYEVLPVVENGKKAYLSLSNNGLVRALQAIDKPCRLKITRSGASYDTKYVVELVK